MALQESVVLTPLGKTHNSTTLLIERKTVEAATGDGKVHVAGGNHQGLIINKETVKKDGAVESNPSQLSLEFRVFLVNAQTGSHTTESRTLRFWFRDAPESAAERATVAQEFFRELAAPQTFPRDYVGFIKTMMKMMQNSYHDIVRLEIVLCQLDPEEMPERPPSTDGSSTEELVELTGEKLLEIIESSYPNPLTVPDLARQYSWDETSTANTMSDLQNRGLVKGMEHGAFTRKVQDETEIQVVKHIPTMVASKQPTVAIVTAQYAEKLAVDAMMENKETFVRYTTIGSGKPGARPRFGESNVYTLGNIGEHRVVCTKLPSVGHTREAMTAAGNTTTRLLGTFQRVEHVLLVGVGGGVPHFTDYKKHVRLGDVVVSHSCSNNNNTNNKFIYSYCESATETNFGKFVFETKEYCSPNTILQSLAANIKSQTESESGSVPYSKYMEQGLKLLGADSEHDFSRPPPSSDKLYMAVGEKDLIEVAHPVPQDKVTRRLEGVPRVHLSAIGAGRDIARSDTVRQQFSQQHHVLAFDPEFDAVIESVIGNCRDSFVCVRGICDYKDGTRKTEWLCYAALAAAAVTKTILTALEPEAI